MRNQYGAMTTETQTRHFYPNILSPKHLKVNLKLPFNIARNNPSFSLWKTLICAYSQPNGEHPWICGWAGYLRRLDSKRITQLVEAIIIANNSPLAAIYTACLYLSTFDRIVQARILLAPLHQELNVKPENDCSCMQAGYCLQQRQANHHLC